MVHRCFPVLFAAGIAALAPATVFAQDDHDHDSCMVEVERTTTRESASDNPVVVYLNGNGGTFRAGAENAAVNRSTVLYGRGVAAINVPAYSRGAAHWDALMSCVDNQFRGFDVEITDRRPSSGSYIMMAVGGRPSMLGLGRFVGGIAPYSGDVIDGAIGFVFERSIAGDRGVCESTAHEIGHTLGLDHSSLCSDTMSYGSCGPKAFRNKAAACGEYGVRSCGSGYATQNSWATLARTVGRRMRTRPTPKPAPPQRTPPRRRDPVARDTGPRVRIVSAPAHALGDSIYSVQVSARDDDGIARVELLWTNGDWAVSLRCGDRSTKYPVRCTRRGDRYTFSLRVGHGSRGFAVRVTDGDGAQSTTNARVTRFWRRSGVVASR